MSGRWIYFISAFLLLSSTAAWARIETQLPLVEVGITGGVFDLPDYPGSDQSRIRTLALPYMIYRGQVLRAGDGSIVKGQFLTSDHLELDVSVAAAFPVNSDKNIAREGMDDLDWIGELGPQLVYHLTPYSRLVELDLVLPVRFAFSTNFTNFNARGLMINPGLQFVHRATFDPDVSFFARVAGKFATESVMDYLYEVDEKFATPERPAYNAQGGFLGMEYAAAIAQKFNDKLRFITALRAETFNGATNYASPLVRTKTNTTIFVGVLWIFAESRKRAFSERIKNPTTF